MARKGKGVFRSIVDGKRFCPACGETKPLSDYYLKASGAPSAYCKPCKLQKRRDLRARAEMTPGTIERFWSKVDKRGPDECWPWKAGVSNSTGYGAFHFCGKDETAHRVSMILAGFEIPEGMFVDHTCRTRICVNPRHLRIVTPVVNALENNTSPFARNRQRTHCPRGHELTGDNIRQEEWVRKGERQCRRCYEMRSRKLIPRGKRKEGWCGMFRKLAVGESVIWPTKRDISGNRKKLKEVGVLLRTEKIDARRTRVTRVA